MTLERKENGKFTFKKLNWSGYCILVSRVNYLANQYVQSGYAPERVMGLVLARLDRRLSKSDHYPLKDTFIRKSKINVSLESEEVLSLYELYPFDASDPICSTLTLEIPKHF